MIGILCEKPSASRNFAVALGGMKSKFNNEDYVIVAARGHLYEYKDLKDMVNASKLNYYKSWNLNNLPWFYEDLSFAKTKKEGTSSLLQSIKKTLKDCDEIVIATDDDPSGEGEMIGWEIIEGLGLLSKKISRMYFVDETKTSIQKAFINRKVLPPRGQDKDYIKADVRSKWDFLSMQFTRIATLCADGKSVLRQGRLKSAMVKLVGHQIELYNNYKKIPFYELRFKDENNNVFSSSSAERFDERNKVNTNVNGSDIVIDKTEMKKISPPKLLDLSKLSAILSKQGFGAKEILSVYQKMYEANIVSYPRTEDKTITFEQFNDLKGYIKDVARVVGVDPNKLTYFEARKTHVKDKGSHGANRPSSNVPSSLSDLDKYGSCARAIYKVLAESTLAMFFDDYEYEQTKAHLKVYPDYTSISNKCVKLGYREVFNDSEDEDESLGFGKFASPFVFEGFPPRAKRATMDWLMKELDKYNVGTGATKTSTYSDVTNQRSKYPLLVDKKGKIDLTEYGLMSYKLLENSSIGDLSITEKLQNDLVSVSENKKSFETVLNELSEMVVNDIEVMKNNGLKMRKDMNIKMDENVKDERVAVKFDGNVHYIKQSFGGHKFTPDEIDKLNNGEEIIIECVGSKGPYKYKGKLGNCEYKGHKYVGFKGDFYNDFPNEYLKYKFTDEEKEKLKNGETVHIDGYFSSKKNKYFGADTTYEDGRIVFHFN